jgi:hypothetical protein
MGKFTDETEDAAEADRVVNCVVGVEVNSDGDVGSAVGVVVVVGVEVNSDVVCVGCAVAAVEVGVASDEESGPTK